MLRSVYCPTNTEIQSLKPGSYFLKTRLHIKDRRSAVPLLIDSRTVIPLLPRVSIYGSARQQLFKLYAANANPISIYGRHNLVLNLGLPRDFDYTLIFSDVPHSILGTDFLSRHNGSLPVAQFIQFQQ